MLCHNCGNTRSVIVASGSWDKFYLDESGQVFDVKELDAFDLPEFAPECGECNSTDIDW